MINLDSRPDRWEQFTAQDRFNTRRVRAVSAEEVGPDQVAQWVGVHKESPLYQERYIRAMIACMRSHRKVIELAKQSSRPYVLVFEDDCVCKQTEIWAREIQDRPRNAELLLFGWELPSRADQRLLSTSYFDPEPAVNRWQCVSFVWKAHCYVAFKSGYQALIDCWSDETIEIDFAWNRMCARKSVYIHRPALAFQAQGFSDILGKVIRRKERGHG